MTDQTGREWPTCGEDGCIGVRLAGGGKCLAHATTRRRGATLRQLGKTGEIDARGVPITQALLEQILAAAPHDAEDHPTFQGTARFDGATFHGDAWFAGATFRRDARFAGATFHGDAGFRGASFQGDAWFAGASFQGDAWFAGASFQGNAQFVEATFQGTTWFGGATFHGDAGFDRATFRGTAAFGMAVYGGATFHGDAGFEGATFQGTAEFGGATFQGTITRFEGATFRRDAGFEGATFQGYAWFGGATFHGDAWFGGATFRGTAGFGGATFQDAGFEGATFRRDAGFDRATFHGDAGFDGATFRRDARFGEARFEQALQLGPILVYGVLRLDAATFAQLIHIEASARGLSCQRTHIPAGVQFRLRGAQIVLDDADLSGPSILVGIAALSDARLARREQRLVQAVRRLAPQAAVELSARPRLLSVQGANVAGLTVSNVDLAECRFAGAHNLDRLRLDTKVPFPPAPVRLPWDWRQVIAEERAWRWRAARSERWATPQWWPAWLHEPYGTEWPGVLPAGQIAGLYRALRKGREDAKDEPDAADFYYGEMEMRRLAGRPRDTGTDNLTDETPRGQVERPANSSTDHPSRAASRGQVERAILTVYWLISGYSQRAWRALAWLAALTAGFAVAFHLAGFTRPPQPVSYWTSLLYAFRATLSLTDDEVKLTAWGKLLQALLRLSGPVLLGLALLAVRARTKR